MGRRKIEIKAIKDDRNRSVTFLKRKGGLFKKAHELSVLCSVDVAVIIFGHNKKLHEFSSCDMSEALSRYQYCGPPHEHKGPEDFFGKRDDDFDEDETTPAPEEGQQARQCVPMAQPHAPTHPGFQHINHGPSVSPPGNNNTHFAARHGTPQSQGASRPSSRNNARRVSSNVGPQHHTTPPPRPPMNSYTYLTGPTLYNPGVHPNSDLQHPRPGQFQQYHRPTSTSHHAPSSLPSHSIPHPVTINNIPTNPMLQHMHSAAPQMTSRPPHSHPLAQQTPPIAFSQTSHLPIQQIAPTYSPERARDATTTVFSSEQQSRTAVATDVAPEQIRQQQTQNQKMEGSQSPPRRMPMLSKSQSIFTPIDDRGSVLARHFPIGPPTEPLSENGSAKAGSNRGSALEGRTLSHPIISSLPGSISEPQRTQSVPAVFDGGIPARANSGQLPPKRPQLKVQIPSENSDRESVTAESTSHDSAGVPATQAKLNTDTSQSGVVLPPPSPSAGVILSAGAQGPPNPFARPPPPVPAAQNSSTYNSNNNNIETPISALPSRFVSDTLLPSPSSFFPEWGFSRSATDSNLLPSPLTFSTPATQSGLVFSRDDEQDKKRKLSDGSSSQEGVAKKTKI